MCSAVRRTDPGTIDVTFFAGIRPDLNPDALVWSHTKRTGVARNPLRKSEKLLERIQTQLQFIANTPALVRSFFMHPPVAGITD